MSIIVCPRYLNDVACHTFLPRINFSSLRVYSKLHLSLHFYVTAKLSNTIAESISRVSAPFSWRMILFAWNILLRVLRASRELRYILDTEWNFLSEHQFSGWGQVNGVSGHEARVVGAQLRLSQQAFSREKLEADWSSVLEVKPIRYGGAREMVMTMLSWGGSGVQQERIHANLSNTKIFFFSYRWHATKFSLLKITLWSLLRRNWPTITELQK